MELSGKKENRVKRVCICNRILKNREKSATNTENKSKATRNFNFCNLNHSWTTFLEGWSLLYKFCGSRGTLNPKQVEGLCLQPILGVMIDLLW